MFVRLAVLIAVATAVLGIRPMPAGAQSEGSRIHLLHGIPRASVDVEADGELLVQGFEFGERADLSEFAGATLSNVALKRSGSDEALLTIGNLELPADGSFTVLAHLDEDGQPTVTLFENDLSQIPAGDGRLTLRHGAQAPLVDVRASNTVVVTGLANRSQAALELAPATLKVDVVPTGSARPRYLGPMDVTVVEGESKIVYVVGSRDSRVFALLEVITDLQTEPSGVGTGLGPVGSDSPSPNALWWLGGAGLISALAVKRLGINT